MRLAPILLTLMLLAWAYLASLAWVLSSVRSKHGPRLLALPLCVTAGIIGAVALPVFGQRGALGFVLSFPAAFLAGLVVGMLLRR